MASTFDPQLSAVAASVEELAGQAARMADEVHQTGASEAGTALFEAERSLQMALRALARARRSLDE